MHTDFIGTVGGQNADFTGLNGDLIGTAVFTGDGEGVGGIYTVQRNRADQHTVLIDFGNDGFRVMGGYKDPQQTSDSDTAQYNAQKQRGQISFDRVHGNPFCGFLKNPQGENLFAEMIDQQIIYDAM